MVNLMLMSMSNLIVLVFELSFDIGSFNLLVAWIITIINRLLHEKWLEDQLEEQQRRKGDQMKHETYAFVFIH